MRTFFAWRRWRQILLAGLWLMSAPAMSAEDEVYFDVRSPAVMAIRKSLVDRHTTVTEYFQAGVIGFTHDGLIARREPATLAADTRATVELLVVEDNRDRGTLYREIARANGRPDWESQFQSAFAGRWIGRAPVGWYYRDSSGRWVKKVAGGVNGDSFGPG